MRPPAPALERNTRAGRRPREGRRSGAPLIGSRDAMFDACISFLRVRDLAATATFYEQTLGLELTLDQGRCRIYRVSRDGYLGFCQGKKSGSSEGVILTLVTDDVDGCHQRWLEQGVQFENPPAFNSEFRIYHCYFRDPDGYLLEVQRFDDAGWSRCN